jgi:hypothetical protein
VGHRSAQVPMTNVHGIRVAGGTFPARIWHDFMAAAVRTDTSDAAGSKSDATKVKVKLCVDSLQLATSRCPQTIEVYLEPENVPKQACTIH